MNRQINILLVDDEEPIREALLLLLKNADYRISGCGSGQEALQLLANEPFDIVITDLFLPDITGIDILKKVKGLSSAIEVILITGHASAETAVKAMRSMPSPRFSRKARAGALCSVATSTPSNLI